MKKFLTLTLALMCFAFCGLLCACENVVPCAWVKLKADGYIYYSSRMYPGSDYHIQLYESEEEFHEQFKQDLLTINFYPRILGADDTADEVRVTTVDVTKPNDVEITVVVNKIAPNSLYSPEKHVYLNDEVLVADPEYTYDGSSIISWTFRNVNLVRGNPGGQFNHFINVIEYK